MIKPMQLVGLAISLCLSVAIPARAVAAEDIAGRWKDTQNGGISEIYHCGGAICIKAVEPAANYRTDVNNPDPKLKGRKMQGVVFMNGAVTAGENRWKGQLYNVEDGNEYTGYINAVGRNEIKLEGCVFGGLICKSRAWVRVQ